MIDSTDLQILRLLQRDAKMTIKEMAADLGLTTTPVFERVRKMEREGLIKGYRAVLDKKKLGLGLTVFCNISLKQHEVQALEKFEREIRNLPEVMECYHIGGMYDYLAKVVVPDMEAYQVFITRKLAAMDNIGKVQSAFVMSEIKEGDSLPIE
jgi:DNA-binding Lrp family transcriptional regulator